jgi:UDP-N-acetylmuramyl pentapeptide phosphotransferase/UDP-N-acetylglucosamine-1-phosphate transferase
MLCITPQLRKLAFKIDYLEKPHLDNERKVHKEPKPYLAAVGIFFTFWISYLIFIRDLSTKTFFIFISSFLIFGTGMVDELYGEKADRKTEDGFGVFKQNYQAL